MGLPERDIGQAARFIAPPGYSRHRPESTLLYQLVAEHYPTFRDRRAAAERPLPRYIEDEFEFGVAVRSVARVGVTSRSLRSIG